MVSIGKRNLVFKEPLEELKTVEKLIIHHTSREDWNIYDTHDFHRNTRKWSGIGYNFFIERVTPHEGEILEGRGFYTGAHAFGNNYNTIGICVAGDFDKDYPTEKQWFSLLEICLVLMEKFHLKPKDILGHRELKGVTKTCPGKNFDMHSLRRELDKLGTDFE